MSPSADPSLPADSQAASTDVRVRAKEERLERRRRSKAAKLQMRELVKDQRRQEMLGYMYRQLKGEYFYFRSLLFVTSFGFACVAVLPTDPTLRLFLTGVFFCVDSCSTLCLLPFEVWWKNLTSAAASVFGVLQILVTLALIDLGLRDASGQQVDLGHSSAAQQASASPSSFGFASEAGWYEMWLGVMVGAVCVLVLYAHWISVRAAAVRAPLLRKRVARWAQKKLDAARRPRGQLNDAEVVEMEANAARRDSALPPPKPKRRRKKKKVKVAPPPPLTTETETPVVEGEVATPTTEPAPVSVAEAEAEKPPPNSPEEDEDDEWEWETDEEAAQREDEEREAERLILLAEAPPPVEETPPPATPALPRHLIFAGKKHLSPQSDSSHTPIRPPLWEPKTPRSLPPQHSPLSFRETPTTPPRSPRRLPTTVSPVRTPRTGVDSPARTPRGGDGSPYNLGSPFSSSPLRTPRSLAQGALTKRGTAPSGMLRTLRMGGGNVSREAGDDVISPSPRPMSARAEAQGGLRLKVQVDDDAPASGAIIAEAVSTPSAVSLAMPSTTADTSAEGVTAPPVDAPAMTAPSSATLFEPSTATLPETEPSVAPALSLSAVVDATAVAGSSSPVASPRVHLLGGKKAAVTRAGPRIVHRSGPPAPRKAESSPSPVPSVPPSPHARPAEVPKLTFQNILQQPD